MSSRRELRLTYADGKCLHSLLRDMNQSWKIMEVSVRLSCEFLHQGTAISKTNWVSTSNMINCKISENVNGNMLSTTCFAIDEQNITKHNKTVWLKHLSWPMGDQPVNQRQVARLSAVLKLVKTTRPSGIRRP